MNYDLIQMLAMAWALTMIGGWGVALVVAA
jgi:hypothetical protein